MTSQRNNSMNKTMLTAVAASALAVMLAGPAVFAESTTPASTTTTAAGPHKGMKLIKELGLSKDQLKQIKSIRSTAKSQIATIKADTTLSDADKKAKIKEVHKDSMKQIQAILTPDQLAKLKQLRQERREEKKSGSTADNE